MKRSKCDNQVKEQQPDYNEEVPAQKSESANIIVEDRYEWIEGVRYELTPAPTITHQKISGNFYAHLYHTCYANGTILYAPVDVYLDEDNQFQPDLIFILDDNNDIITEKRIEGAPDLILEILSPSTSQNDKIRKKRQYERFGVKEYWIADPVHRTVDQFILKQAGYVLFNVLGEKDHLTSPLFSCISVDLDRVFPALRP